MPDLGAKLRRHVEAANRWGFDAAPAIFSKGIVSDRSPLGQEVVEGRDPIRDFVEDRNAVFQAGEPEALKAVCLDG